ncbi:DUF4139 domain-containing protein [Halochromatium glycolicum]|uniref:DUF4139 domain-containing protein n=1 Tax=Halochromatium glycolicum TaxID=85075 RepID=A0AAJ0XA93_9GAMM|nr:DUF4139 domain-containing protein [Halochromatium glycolicum]MBK1704557.1 DUF4139 domain-containing protein [Halochromatium glycolicum]
MRTVLAAASALLLCAIPLEGLMAETAMDAAALSQASKQRSTLEDQAAVAVTIYNDDLALIKDSRRVTLPAGRTELAFRDVSAQIRPETALLRTIEGIPPSLIEQNFDFDLLTPGALLEKYVGREVGLVTRHPTTGEETEEPAVVLAASDGVVLRVGDRIETFGSGQTPGRIVYRDIPPNLRDRPTLVLALDSDESGERLLELSYLSRGLSWKADYVGELAPGQDRLDLAGWVTLENRSGSSYRDAQLQLVAGDVNQVEEDMRQPQYEAMATRAAQPTPNMREEGLFEYHLYTLSHPTTIADNQTKQVALLDAADVVVDKELIVQGDQRAYREPRGELWQDLDVSVYLNATNDEASNLGLPLPAGIVRIYQRDSEGNLQFIGEDRIDHTPKNESLRLKLGQSFDVTAERQQTEFTKLSGSGPWKYQFEGAYAIRIKNAKPEAQQLTVQERIPGDWTMLDESAPHEQGNANTAIWDLEVPAEGETRLSYRVRVRF